MMFNEAFWFFYVVGLFEGLTGLLFAALVIFVTYALARGFYIEEELQGDAKSAAWKSYSRWVKVYATVTGVVLLLVFFAPSEKAMYAGAGQYVAEYSEIDDTLLHLKNAIDAKLEELSGDGVLDGS